MRPWTGWERFALAALGAALLLPLFRTENGGWGRPRLWEGDQPHYLVMLHSLVNDYDLDLGNNYRQAHEGGPEGGLRFRRSPALDHHTVFWRGDKSFVWCDAFECDGARWDRDSDTDAPVPHRREDFKEDLTGLIERPWHPAGLAFVLAPFAWPFRQTPLIERVALFVAGGATVLAMLLFHLLIRSLAVTGRQALLITSSAFLGSAAWHYGRSIFTEGFLLLFAVAAYEAFLRRQRSFAAGVWIGLGMMLKPPFGVLAAPLLFDLARQKKWRELVLLGLPCGVATVATLLLNWHLYGSPWRPPQPFQWGNPLGGVGPLLFDPKHGLIPFTPVILLALAGWPRFLREHGRTAGLLLAGALSYFALMCCWARWDGGWCYGPRLILPIVPLLMTGMLGFRPARRWALIPAGALILLSMEINGRSALQYWDVYDRPPQLLSSAEAARPAVISA